MLLGVRARRDGRDGWATTAMAARYQHVTDPVRADIANRVGGLLWQSKSVATSPPQRAGLSQRR
jgi:integrase